ncbi:SRPBCC family protein [Nocardia higoensis]|uniref:SRPBCC family protein n=1 Tax=Nocardia higoensis TaxID=228599 RepID=A0ABS0D5V0_9NOCA|nr:SRPBCC family protein [Nocardia higoensis]MBF6353042.1 SRPBCC family protein [Nocardia higoensis]
MYLLADTRVTASCSDADAFAFTADLENFPHWFPGVESVTAADDLAPETPGKRYAENITVPFRGTATISLHVREACPPARLVTEGNLPILRPRMEIDIHAIDAEHCAIRWRMYSRADARVLRWTLLPLAAAVMRRRARVGLRNLARHLDTSSGISEPMNPSAPKV